MRSALLRTGLGVCLLGLVLSLLTGARATALVPESCRAGYFCIYDGADGQTRLHEYAGGAADYDLADWKNRVGSVRNDTDYWGCLYDGAYYGGEIQAIRPRSSAVVNLTDKQLVDQAESLKLAKSKAGCSTGYERCDQGYVCLFKDVSGRGVMTSVGVSAIAQYNAGWDDQVVSVFNHTAKHVCFYSDADYTGTFPGTSYPTFVVLSGDNATLQDPYVRRFSSHQQVEETGQC